MVKFQEAIMKKTITKYSSLLLAALVSTGVVAEWKVEKTTDPITDVENQRIVAVNEDKTGMFVVACYSNEHPLIWVAISEYLGTKEYYLHGDFRVDKNPVMQLRIHPHKGDGKMVYVDDPKLEFANKLVDGKQLAVRLRDYEGQPHTRVFDLTGAKEALEEIKPFCEKR